MKKILLSLLILFTISCDIPKIDLKKLPQESEKKDSSGQYEVFKQNDPTLDKRAQDNYIRAQKILEKSPSYKEEIAKEKKISGKQKLRKERDELKSMRIAFCYQLNQNLSLYDVDVKIVTPACVKLMITGDKSTLIMIASSIKSDPVTMRRLREYGFKEIYFTNMWGYGYHLYI